jgi:hypothetical protein
MPKFAPKGVKLRYGVWRRGQGAQGSAIPGGSPAEGVSMTRIISYVHCYKPAQEEAKSSGLSWSCDRHHEKEQLEKRRLRFFLDHAAATTGQHNPAHRALRNVTAP